jgi:hypothetical protein
LFLEALWASAPALAQPKGGRRTALAAEVPSTGSAPLEELNRATHHLRASAEQLNQEVASFKA